MDDIIRDSLNVQSVVKRSNGLWIIDRMKVFIKTNSSQYAEILCKGEAASLAAIHQTGTVKTPQVIGVFESKKGTWHLACRFIDMEDRNSNEMLTILGENIAKMHSHNPDLIKRSHDGSGEFVGERREEGEKRFGFSVPTSCGVIPQSNEWCDDWRTFFIRCRLKPKIDYLVEKENDHTLSSEWSQLERVTNDLLKPTQSILPSLLHGDLWSGNWAVEKNEPVVFDPASSYSDPEFESGIQNMFGGFGGSYNKGYDKIIHIRPQWNQRRFLYTLYHNLNHWCHFGSSYRTTSLSLISTLISSNSDSD